MNNIVPTEGKKRLNKAFYIEVLLVPLDNYREELNALNHKRVICVQKILFNSYYDINDFIDIVLTKFRDNIRRNMGHIESLDDVLILRVIIFRY